MGRDVPQQAKQDAQIFKQAALIFKQDASFFKQARKNKAKSVILRAILNNMALKLRCKPKSGPEFRKCERSRATGCLANQTGWLANQTGCQ